MFWLYNALKTHSYQVTIERYEEGLPETELCIVDTDFVFNVFGQALEDISKYII